MNDLTITLSDDHFSQLKEKASNLGITLEALVILSIEELLSRPEDDFIQAVDYILEKNAELYKRLA